MSRFTVRIRRFRTLTGRHSTVRGSTSFGQRRRQVNLRHPDGRSSAQRPRLANKVTHLRSGGVVTGEKSPAGDAMQARGVRARRRWRDRRLVCCSGARADIQTG